MLYFIGKPNKKDCADFVVRKRRPLSTESRDVCLRKIKGAECQTVMAGNNDSLNKLNTILWKRREEERTSEEKRKRKNEETE